MFKYFDGIRNLYAPSLKKIVALAIEHDQAWLNEHSADQERPCEQEGEYDSEKMCYVGTGPVHNCAICDKLYALDADGGVYFDNGWWCEHCANPCGSCGRCHRCNGTGGDDLLTDEVVEQMASVHHAGEQDEEAFQALKHLQVATLADTIRRNEEHTARFAECLRVRDLLASYGTVDGPKRDGKCVTPMTKEDAMSKAARLSKKRQIEHSAYRFISGPFVGLFIVVSSKAYYTKQVNDKLRVPKRLKDQPGLMSEEGLNDTFTCIRSYRNNRMCWPASSINMDRDRQVSTYSDLTTARRVATAISLHHPGNTIELCISRKPYNETPYVVFFEAKPRNMDLIACYESTKDGGCTERLMREARQMQTLTTRCVLNTWAVTWREGGTETKEHSGFVQAASASEAWHIIYNHEVPTNASMADEAKNDSDNNQKWDTRPDAIFCMEIERMDSGSKKDDDEDKLDQDLAGLTQRWAEGSDEHCDPGYVTYRSLEEQDNDPDPEQEKNDAVITPTHSMVACYERMDKLANRTESVESKILNDPGMMARVG